MTRWRAMHWLSIFMLGLYPLVPMAVRPPLIGVATVINIYANWPSVKAHPTPFLRRLMGATNRDITAFDYLSFAGSAGLIMMIAVGCYLYVI